MRKSLHIVLPVLLIAALAFNQVGLGFFHDRHDAHERYEPSQIGKPLLVKHNDHCKVCSIDVLFNLFCESPRSLLKSAEEKSFLLFNVTQAPHLAETYTQGRAPPFSF